MITLRRLTKIPNTDPQEYEIAWHDSEKAAMRSGYVQNTERHTEEEIRAMLKNGGMTDGEIEVYLVRAS